MVQGRFCFHGCEDRGLMSMKEGARQPSCPTRQPWTLTCAPPGRLQDLASRSAFDITLFRNGSRMYTVSFLARPLSTFDVGVAQAAQQACSSCAVVRA